MLTIQKINNALTAGPHNGQNYFFLDKTLLDIVEEATAAGYVRRISHTQAEWATDGLRNASYDLPLVDEKTGFASLGMSDTLPSNSSLNKQTASDDFKLCSLIVPIISLLVAIIALIVAFIR